MTEKEPQRVSAPGVPFFTANGESPPALLGLGRTLGHEPDLDAAVARGIRARPNATRRRGLLDVHAVHWRLL